MDAQEIVDESDAQAPPAEDASPAPDSPGGESPGEGLTVREAALRSGMTEKMIRVRIRNGTIDSWKVQGKFGPEWRVRLPEGEEAATPPEAHTDDGTEETDEVPVAPAPSAPAARERSAPASAPPPSAPAPAPHAGVTVPVDLFHDFLVRHEEISIRLGRAEALIETAQAQAPAEAPAAPAPPEASPAPAPPSAAPQAAPAPEPEPSAPPAEAREQRDVPPSQSVERLQRIARDEAEARYRAEVEVARLRQALQAAERTIEDLRGLLKSLGMAG